MRDSSHHVPRDYLQASAGERQASLGHRVSESTCLPCCQTLERARAARDSGESHRPTCVWGQWMSFWFLDDSGIICKLMKDKWQGQPSICGGPIPPHFRSRHIDLRSGVLKAAKLRLSDLNIFYYRKEYRTWQQCVHKTMAKCNSFLLSFCLVLCFRLPLSITISQHQEQN